MEGTLPGMPLNFTVDNFTCYDPSVEGYRYFGVLWGVAVTLVGTVGNSLTLLAFATDRKLQTPFNALILNLTVADLLYCTFLQPISVDSYLHLRWRCGPSFCRLFGLLLFLSNSVSVLTLCLIAASRYLLIAHRQTFERIFCRSGLVLILLSTWALGLASFSPLWNFYVFAKQVCTCSFHRVRAQPYTTILLFFYFIFAQSCVGVFYFLIHRKVRLASKNLEQYKLPRAAPTKTPVVDADSGLESISTNVTDAPESSEMSTGRPNSSETWTGRPKRSMAVGGTVVPPASKDSDGEFRRVNRMCFTVFLCFVFCFAPFLLLNIFDKKGQAPQVVHMLCANLTWLNSCINPILYAAMNRQFSQAYRSLLGRLVQPLVAIWPRK
ncbi:G-protein coupled receptor 84 isoform X2 [Polypterus senegalus]|uniref:G-protein coupled receptor 84 isoform X2 n=1 Tax=Polypterus senegalus TaxID=55291 RepID=UPI0019650413|nr:G-protein coupled receptor 84 isoform X2 [Polypterus senegalus]